MNTSLEQLLSALLPGESPYVVFQSDDPPVLAIMPNCWAATGRTYDVVLRDWLQSRGQWRGRHPAIYVNDVGIRQFAKEQASEELAAEVFARQLTIASTSHEVGHIIEAGIDRTEVTPKLTDYAGAVAAFSIAISDDDSGFPPFFGHGPQFIRLAIHCWHRATKAGFESPIDWLFPHEAYGFPAYPSDFASALGEEPSNLEREPLADIPLYRPRKYFIDLW
jgi:hypothetical protein